MAENTAISWCDHTFNPWMGCTKVSPACRNCYAEELMDTRYGKVEWGPEGERVRTSQANWDKVKRWNREARKLNRKPLVFCASLADVAEDRPELVAWRADLCQLIRQCESLQFLLLSKRPENYTRMFPQAVLELCWVGSTAEDQEWYDHRARELAKVPAKLRFFSLEPLLGPIALQAPFEPNDDDWEYVNFGDNFGEDEPEDYITEAEEHCDWINFSDRKLVESSAHIEWRQARTYCAKTQALKRLISWFIVGGESGQHRRALDIPHVESIERQCRTLGIPLLVKQDSAPYAGFRGRLSDALWACKQWPLEAYHIPTTEAVS